jgi:delta8-fatty-acid desaturase
MDVVCDEWIEFFHGGLHLQVTHHLFPRIPRHNLRRASKLVKDYCKEQDMEYAEYSFTEGNRRVLRVLRDVANQVTLLGKVAAADARGELH